MTPDWIARENELKVSLERHGVRPSLHGGIIRYLISGIQPGDFLASVLRNNLRMAVCRADDEWTLGELKKLMLWLWNEAPAECWGSAADMNAWMEAKRKELVGA